MARVTNDREECPDRPTTHVWELRSQLSDLSEIPVLLHVCHYCGAERLSRWIDKESESDNRKKDES